jgi:hypothetical protein
MFIRSFLAGLIASLVMALAVGVAQGVSLRVGGGLVTATVPAPNFVITDSVLGNVAGALTLTITLPGGTYSCNGFSNEIGDVTAGAIRVTSPSTGVSAVLNNLGALLWLLETRCQLSASGDLRVYIDWTLFRITALGTIFSYSSSLNAVWFDLSPTGWSIANLRSNSIFSDRGSTAQLSAFSGSVFPFVSWSLI